MAPPPREALERLYAEAVYEVEFEDGLEQFAVGAMRSGRPPFFIITAYNAGLERPSHETNEAANRDLLQLLTAAGLSFCPAVGRNRQGTHVEPSFAVFDIDEATALALARRFRQAAVVHWDGEDVRILWCNQP